MAVRDFKKFFKKVVDLLDSQGTIKRPFKEAETTKMARVKGSALDAKIQIILYECPKPPRDKNQRAFVGGSWSDSGGEDDEKIQDEACLVAQAPNEVPEASSPLCAMHTMEVMSFLVAIFAVTSLAKCRVTFSEHDSEITKDGKVVGYSQNSKEYIILNKHTRTIEESLNVTFDETPPPSKTSPLVDDTLDEEMKAIKGIDYDETYAPVARLESIMILLAYARALDFKLFQMDVKSAFLNGFINEKVYMAQPPRFIDFKKPDHVYKLKKALYGLKQAPKAWYDRLKAFLIKHEYKMGMVDNTLFTKKKSSNLIIVQIYVDDIIFGSTCQDICDEFSKIMHDEFEMSMMGEINFFLGLQIKQMEDGKSLSLTLEEFGQILKISFKGQASHTEMYSLDHLSISVSSKGRYKTKPPSPNVVKSLIQVPRQGQETRTKNKKTIITQTDRGKKRPRESNASSSSTTQNHPSSSLPLDTMVDENDDESFHSNSSSSQNVSSSSNVVPGVYQNPPHESHNLNTYLSETINIQTQQKEAYREGLRSIGQAIKNMMKGKRK
ncbi:retrovirus-related pol polyprotein from transposon TNT 1-94 [Tanacetum coccineum]|uniref:Retrovirus-related pol polyprotein from transposon TNT 1-94 n=1 Tax=Tanacetum coccineum TaxID=301880 RepID=A0ABQ5AQC6_9ASTR